MTHQAALVIPAGCRGGLVTSPIPLCALHHGIETNPGRVFNVYASPEARI